MSHDPQEVISVYRAGNVAEAHLVKDLLLGAGIEAMVTDEHEPFAGLTIVPPDVMVRRADEASARELLERYEAKQGTEPAAESWNCPNCGEDVPASFDECFHCGTANRSGT